MTAILNSKKRLQRAAEDLSEATHTQHINFITFTDTLDDLRFAIEQLDHSCRTFQATSKSLSVDKLRRRSLRLAHIMGSVEA